jgi:hypothetical protein
MSPAGPQLIFGRSRMGAGTLGPGPKTLLSPLLRRLNRHMLISNTLYSGLQWNRNRK